MRSVWLRSFATAVELAALMVLVPVVNAPPALAQGGLAPGVYVTSLRIDPAQPTPNVPISFYATFFNNSGPYSNVRWAVYIFQPGDYRHSIGETSKDAHFDIPVGTTELQALGGWKIGIGEPCRYFTAQVAWLDDNNKATPYLKPDGSNADFPLTVCDFWPTVPPPTAPVPVVTSPPTVAPSPTANSTAAPVAVSGTPDLDKITLAMREAIRIIGTEIKGAPLGLYVTGMRLDPIKPAHGQNVSLFASFLNSASADRKVRWKVYIYGADNQINPNTESAVVQETFASGPALDQKVPIAFKFGPTGKNCDYFFMHVVVLDKDNEPFELNTPDGQMFEQSFSVCQ